jgi:hypothetical protein
MVVADRSAGKSASEKASITNATKKTTTNKITPVVADRIANEFIPAPAPAATKPATVLDIINQANTFKPGVPASIKAPAASTQSLTVPNAPAPDFSRGNYNTVSTSPISSSSSQPSNSNAVASTSGSSTTASPVVNASPEKVTSEAPERAQQEALARQPRPLVSVTKEPVKYATPSDVLIDTNDLPIDLIIKLTLEKIGGLELISLVRHDTVNGQNIIYRPIKNVSQLAIEYNPQNMVKMPDSADSYFKNFAIKLENYIQQETNELPPLVAYIDPITKNVIIETTSMKADYEVEVQMVSSGKVFDDTIYTEDYS